MPRRTSHQNLALFLCWAALLLSSPVSAAPRRQNNNNKDSNNNNNPLASLHQHYEQLSPKGKAVAGATAGFVGSRIALKTVTRVVKYGAAAFIAAEVLQLTGVMDQIPGKCVHTDRQTDRQQQEEEDDVVLALFCVAAAAAFCCCCCCCYVLYGLCV